MPLRQKRNLFNFTLETGERSLHIFMLEYLYVLFQLNLNLLLEYVRHHHNKNNIILNVFT